MSRRLVENITSLYIVQGLTLLIGLLMQPFLARSLGPEYYGKIAFAQAFMQYFVLITDYGFNWSATHQIALCRNDKNAVSEIFWSTQAAKLCLLLASFLMLVAVVIAVPRLRQDLPLFLVSFLLVVGNTLVPIWYFQGMESLKYVAFINIVARAITLVIILAFVRNPTDYLIAAGAQSAVGLLMGMAAFGVIYVKLPLIFKLPTGRQIWSALTEGWVVFLSTVSHSVYTATNITLLGFVASPEVFGIFSAANKVVQAITGVLSPFVQSLFPTIAHVGATDKAQARTIILKYVRYGAIVFGAISLVLLIWAGPIMTLLFGREFAEGRGVLQCMAPIPAILSMSHCFATLYLLGAGYKREWSRVIISTQLVNFGFLGALSLVVPFQYAVAITLTANELWVLGASYWYWKRRL